MYLELMHTCTIAVGRKSIREGQMTVETNPVDLVNLVLNGGSTAVMLFLYLRLESRYDTLQTRTLAILERLADIQEAAARS